MKIFLGATKTYRCRVIDFSSYNSYKRQYMYNEAFSDKIKEEIDKLLEATQKECVSISRN